MKRDHVRLVILAFCALLIPGRISAANPNDSMPSLDLATRFVYQRAMEEVMWRHRIWPKENPGPQPALEKILPRAVIEANVEKTLRLSNALEQYWGQPITGMQLQAEMERQARNSKQPELLRELWSALGNDPRLIAEMLARPALVERLARNWYSGSALAVDGRSFDEWWQLVNGGLSVAISEPAYAYRLPKLQPREDGSWTPTFALPEADLESTAVWTGVEMIVWGGTEVGAGKFNSGSRYNPATDTWRPTSGFGAPEVRKQHSAVWTGTEMIVWGGCGPGDEHSCQIGSGGRYNPATDTWLSTSDAGTNRLNHTAVWTGTEMIIWGGCAFSNDLCRPDVVGSGGVRYDPVTDTWQPTSLVNAPQPRHFHTANWTGNEMVVWGGRDDGLTEAFNTGGRYNPVTDTWQAISLTNAPPPRYDHTAVWTSRHVIVWGGNNGTRDFNDGRRYDPRRDVWQAVRRNGAPEGRTLHTAVWTGQEMIVWGGCSVNNIGFCENFLNSGGRYNPRTNSWTPTNSTNAPEARSGHLAVWTGSLMVIWGGSRTNSFGTPRTGGRYDPVADLWTPTNASEAPSARSGHTALWTGAEMIIWGGADRFFGEVATGGRYAPATDSWQPTSLNGAPDFRQAHSAIWTGTQMVIWGGQVGSFIYNSGGRYNPASNSWTATATGGAPAARGGHSAVWTGQEMIVWGGSGNPLWMNTGGHYNPNTNSWVPTTTSGAPMGRDNHTAVWTGNEMIVWGGFSSVGTINSGGRYNPAANSWTPVSLVGAPVHRTSHAGVWTGSKMIIWGGSQFTSGGTFDFLRTGGQYAPASDSWTPTSLVSAPSERASFAYVWTGSELMVWAGCSGAATCSEATATGGQYDPVADQWIPTALVQGPSSRFAPTGVWTGGEMIVFGGVTEESDTFTNHGGRYTPSSGTNTAPPITDEVAAADLTRGQSLGEEAIDLVETKL